MNTGDGRVLLGEELRKADLGRPMGDELMDVKNKVVLITGASAGIGRATSKLLFREGAKVAMAARRENKLREVAEGSEGSLIVPTDMTNIDSVRKMVHTTFTHYGRLDILINNAGQGMHRSIEQTDLNDLDALMRLNVYGPLIAMQEVVPIMKGQGGGAIINISSAVSKMAIPYIGGYAATKYALNALSLTARSELAKDGISVSIVLPGLTATDFSKNYLHSSNDHRSQGRPQGSMPIPDPPELVAERILDAIKSGIAVQYMSKEQSEHLNHQSQ